MLPSFVPEGRAQAGDITVTATGEYRDVLNVWPAMMLTSELCRSNSARRWSVARTVTRARRLDEASRERPTPRLVRAG